MQPKLNAREAWVRAISRKKLDDNLGLGEESDREIRPMSRDVTGDSCYYNIPGGITIEIEAFLVVTLKIKYYWQI